MINTQFEAYKIWREVKRSGRSFTFKRPAKNQFGEQALPQDNNWVEGKDNMVLKGLYHEQNEYISVITGDTTQTRTKKSRMILCLWEHVSELGIQAGDLLQIGDNKWLKVTGVLNIQEWSIIGDISLEVLDGDGFTGR